VSVYLIFLTFDFCEKKVLKKKGPSFPTPQRPATKAENHLTYCQNMKKRWERGSTSTSLQQFYKVDVLNQESHSLL
jgi:hypothetical protein